jgi:hypothetical protein
MTADEWREIYHSRKITNKRRIMVIVNRKNGAKRGLWSIKTAPWPLEWLLLRNNALNGMGYAHLGVISRLFMNICLKYLQ